MEASLYPTFFAIEEHYWWSVGTRAIFREWLSRATGGRAGRVLDIGCGTGMLARELATLGIVHGVDIAPEAIRFGRARGLDNLCVGSAEALPYRRGTFDAVAAVDVVEHADDVATLAELARVLRPGGVALIHVPAFPFLWSQHDEAAHHRRRYRRAQLRALVEAQGLHVERLSFLNALLFPPVAVVRIVRQLRSRLRPMSLPPRADIYLLPTLVNRLLIGILALERRWLRTADLPLGVSLLCLARKTSGV
ncbi:MAG: class I SAM-dependent methyltransferase [Candidatus Binatia bacterium]